MSVSLSVQGFSSAVSAEFKKHYRAVEFCIHNDLSYPKETSEFFKGRICGDNIESFDRKRVLELIKNGIEVEIPKETDAHGQEIRIKVSDIPKEVDLLIIKLD